MSRKIRLAVIVLVLVNLAATAAYALPPAGRPFSSGQEGVLTAAWEWLASLFFPAGETELQVAWEKAGSSMDPNGDPHLVSGEGTSQDGVDLSGNK
jgi:hypothetical protein